MKKSVQLSLTLGEKQLLRQQNIKLAELPAYTADEIAAILKASPDRAREIQALIEFQSIPSLGPRFARELIDQGYYSLEQLRGKDPVELFEAYEKYCGAWADPCVEDSYRLLVHYINHRDDSKRWWDFTPERKAHRVLHGFPADRPVRAWHELAKYRKPANTALATHKQRMTMADLTELPRGIAEFVSRNNAWQQTLGESGIFGIAASMQEQLNRSTGLMNLPNLGRLSSIAEQITKTHGAMEFIKPYSAMDKMVKTLGMGILNPDVFEGSVLYSEVFKKLATTGIFAQIATSPLQAKLQSPEWLQMMTAVNGISALAERSLGAFDWQALGSSVHLAQESVRLAQKNFLSFSGGYADLIKSYQDAPAWLVSKPMLGKLPSLEYYTHSRLLETVSSEQDPSDDEINVQDEIAAENIFSIEGWLPLLHNNLPNLWNGAVYALDSDNPDKVRHFITSIRELYTHLMHILAPDDAIRAWSADAKHYDEKGKPTRKSRLYYICRNISGGAYQTFMDKDITATIELIDLFNKGTHGIDIQLTAYQLRAIRIKAETTLRFILETEFTTNR